MIKDLKKDPLYHFIVGKKKKNLFLLILSLIPSVLAGLMEGFSYVSLILAVNVLIGQGVSSLPVFSFLLKYVLPLSQNRQFLILIIFSLVVQIIRSSFLFLSQYIVSIVSLKISTKLQQVIYSQIFNFSYPFVSRYQAGDLLSYNSAPLIIPSIISQINIAFSSAILSLFSLAWLIKIDVILTTALFLFFLLVNYTYKVILKKVSSLSSDLTQEEVKFNSQSNQNINGLKLIHMFNKQNYIVEKTKSVLQKIARSNTSLTFWKTLIKSFGEIIGIIVIALLLIFGAFLMRYKTFFMSYLLTFIFISYRFSTRLQIIMNNIGDIIAQKGSILRLKAILKKCDKEYLPQGGITLKSFQKHINFKNISLTYNERANKALESFTFCFNKGKTYAIVGRSGSGKSTLIDLLLNLYSPTEGKILVDEMNLKDISLESWRSKIGIVNQDIFLFHDTIEDNIRFGNQTASLEEIKQAAKLSYAEDFILELPQKYQTIVGEKGHKLSGGERQRIAVARALIKNPDILILDEATSQLDSHSEKLIQKAIDDLRKEKTIIIVAHRLSTIVNADEILVLNNGKLIENGNHETLLEKQGAYAKFWNIQSKTSIDKKASINTLEKTF